MKCKYCLSNTNSCNDIEAETCENYIKEITSEVTTKEPIVTKEQVLDTIAATKAYIKLPFNREMNEEERYYNPRVKEYDAFLAGVKYAMLNK